MTKVVGVRFRETGKVYYFSPNGLAIKKGDHVIVESARGQEYGFAAFEETEVSEDRIIPPLKNVVRIATKKDEEHVEENHKKEKDAKRICLEKIEKRALDMKLIDVEYAFDNSRLLFYFTADGRVDFRELVKDLAAEFKTRIELRQIGVRDETKLLGGIGICGRELCCHTYLHDFAPVSIKMAKEQNLSLNPTKISGNCGRLMCCLRNEQETYEYLHKKLPNKGDIVYTLDGIAGEVADINILRQTVRVLIEDGDQKEIREYPVEELKIKHHNKKKKKNKENAEQLSAEEEQALKELEELEGQE
ncbi:MAG TPA: stage 0 sporulation family protein [Candidatus Alectryocaccobium stercorigallinarum]|jgi:cell fate regulator YaaT (PSP1 superfamily)|nr:stage 0 sporulation family protein [Candidatus Alectryocaccobium stercorigallinarum]